MERCDDYCSRCTCGPNCCPRSDPCEICCFCQKAKQGDLTAAQGNQDQMQDQAQDQMQEQLQGDLSAAQGNQDQMQDQAQDQMQEQLQGDLSAAQGNQDQTQGNLSSAQGDLTETLGDMYQLQGGESQGDQSQSITGHEGQTQGDQVQGEQSYGDQTHGDQTLSSNPTISTPVDVSGVNVNVTVSCCDQCKSQEGPDCQEQCRKSITSLLRLIDLFSQAIADPTSSQFLTNYSGSPQSWTLGNLVTVSDCRFTIMPNTGESKRIFLVDTLEALLIEPTASEPNLFSLLLAYLQSSHSSWPFDSEDSSTSSDPCCFKELSLALQAYYTEEIKINIFLQNTLVNGYIYKVKNKIVFLVNDLDQPRLIYAIPICKILSYQASEMPV